MRSRLLLGLLTPLFAILIFSPNCEAHYGKPLKELAGNRNYWIKTGAFQSPEAKAK